MNRQLFDKLKTYLRERNRPDLVANVPVHRYDTFTSKELNAVLAFREYNLPENKVSRAQYQLQMLEVATQMRTENASNLGKVQRFIKLALDLKTVPIKEDAPKNAAIAEKMRKLLENVEE